jgi:hypothetical protein
LIFKIIQIVVAHDVEFVIPAQITSFKMKGWYYSQRAGEVCTNVDQHFHPDMRLCKFALLMYPSHGVQAVRVPKTGKWSE